MSPKVDAAYPQAWGVEISLECADGRRFSASRTDAKGDPESPLSEPELIAKSRTMLLESGLSAERTETLIESILALTTDRPVRELRLASYLDPAGATSRRTGTV